MTDKTKIKTMVYQYNDIIGLLSYTIVNYKTQLISNLNSLGYSTSLNASNEDLLAKLKVILTNEGLDKIRQILSINIDTTRTSRADISNISSKFPPDPTAKTLLEQIKDWIIPGSTSTGAGSSSTEIKTPALNPMLVAGIVVAAIIAMVVVYKMK